MQRVCVQADVAGTTHTPQESSKLSCRSGSKSASHLCALHLDSRPQGCRASLTSRQTRLILTLQLAFESESGAAGVRVESSVVLWSKYLC